MQTYALADVPLIPQTKDMACWYASAQMLMAWRRSRTLACEAGHPDPSQVPTFRTMFANNDGLPPSQIMELARSLGLKDVPPMTPSPGYLASMLQSYGPLWFAGYHPSGHVVVITGVSNSGVSINNPWPVGTGVRETITFQRFGEILQPIRGGGWVDWTRRLLGQSGGNLTANLLHFPG
jgi:hypothetical protein